MLRFGSGFSLSPLLYHICVFVNSAFEPFSSWRRTPETVSYRATLSLRVFGSFWRPCYLPLCAGESAVGALNVKVVLGEEEK